MSDASAKNDFIVGVVEGFYGRPWTTEQRKDLFRKLKKFGMNSFVYAPKDDCKHRAYWRELYTVEEAENLSGLITAARENEIVFYYALSPGLDITYSSPKEMTTLKRKLDQVSQFGCDAFALLFDDIEPEMSKSDKEVFQSFAHAQVSVTNEVYQHLNSPKFMFCPTQYCSTRAVPNVVNSDYLNTLGSQLVKEIDILWTGQKVITKTLTIEGIQEITDVLRRKPLIWDNLHANDYDPKRMFLGPYSGRSPELIPLLKGVLTNPNCEYHANTIAIHTLAHWAQCSSEISTTNSADVKLETEIDGDYSEDAPAFLNKKVYHPRLALKNAVADWLPEFSEKKEVTGRNLAKPHPAVTMVMPIIPILPSINTCMTLTSTTTSTTTTAGSTLPEVNTTHLQAFADVCSTVTGIEPVPILNSLVSATKVVSSNLSNPIMANITSNIALPDKIPLSSLPIAKMKDDDDEIKPIDVDEELKVETEQKDVIVDTPIENNEADTVNDAKDEDDVPIESIESLEKPDDDEDETNGIEAMQDEPPVVVEPMDLGCVLSPKHTPKSDDILMSDTASSPSGGMHIESSDISIISSDMSADKFDKEITADDLLLLCDLFYLPFEHGSKALRLLNEFNWLKSNACTLLANGKKKGIDGNSDVQEWMRRADAFDGMYQAIQTLARKIALCDNREICFDLYSYVWEINGVTSLLAAFVKWLALGQFPENINNFTQGSYTWFSKGWKEAFMSGDQEPWVFRGGLAADLQRLIPIDCGNDLFTYKLPDSPISTFYSIRPYIHTDEKEVYAICHKTCRDGSDCSELFPEGLLQGIPGDRLVGPFLTLAPELCMVIEANNGKIVGYACAALDAKAFYRNQEMCWLPEMCLKYPLSLLDEPGITQAAKDSINHFHNFKFASPQNVLNTHPSIITCCILKEQLSVDQSVCKRVITVLLAALRSNGSFGVHVCINSTDGNMFQFYSKLGFVEIYQDETLSKLCLGRNF